MKKALIGISGVAILALAVILFVNAGPGTKESKNTTTELKADCGSCPSASTCTEAEKNAKSETASATAPACCDKEKVEGTAKACPEGAKAASSSPCGGCPMSQKAVTR